MSHASSQTRNYQTRKLPSVCENVWPALVCYCTTPAEPAAANMTPAVRVAGVGQARRNKGLTSMVSSTRTNIVGYSIASAPPTESASLPLLPRALCSSSPVYSSSTARRPRDVCVFGYANREAGAPFSRLPLAGGFAGHKTSDEKGESVSTMGS